ncbi:MAG: hypothetical protein QM608_13905 [Caulobacter sp.]
MADDVASPSLKAGPAVLASRPDIDLAEGLDVLAFILEQIALDVADAPWPVARVAEASAA